MLVNIATLDHEPIIGQAYLANAIKHQDLWHPIIGNLHTDPEFTGQQAATIKHYHVDMRLLDDKLWKFWGMNDNKFLNSPYGFFPAVGILNESLTEKDERPFVCQRSFPDYRKVHLHTNGMQDVESKFKDHIIKLDKPICPHHGAPLGNVPIRDGVLTCPLHGLNWCSKTGKLLPKRLECL